MSDSAHVLQARHKWISLYEETGDAGFVCRRCGISRPTLRKWWCRFQEHGEQGLRSNSRRPHNSPNGKITAQDEELILGLRRERKLGPLRMQAELLRLHDLRLWTATIRKVLDRRRARPLQRRRSSPPKRYSRKAPGECVQVDTRKIAPGVYQYTAVDDCTRLRVLGSYPRRTAENSAHFLEERMVYEFPFPIQRVQSDRGGEFFGLPFQRALRDYCIKFGPSRPRSPHLNGKVERSQQTDEMEFWMTADLKDPELSLRLEERQFFYNRQRSHSALGGRTPMGRCCELTEQTPPSGEAYAGYDPEKGLFQERDYKKELQLRKLKRCL